MNLLELKPNQTAQILSIDIEDKIYKLRLCELGLFEGAEISLIYFSLLKRTVLLKIFNSVFAIKSNIAKNIKILKNK